MTCNVHAEPFAEVRWYKKIMLLDQTSNRNMKKFGNRHVLVIRNINEKDFGNYSCLADNSLGRALGERAKLLKCQDVLMLPEFSVNNSAEERMSTTSPGSQTASSQFRNIGYSTTVGEHLILKRR